MRGEISSGWFYFHDAYTKEKERCTVSSGLVFLRDQQVARSDRPLLFTVAPGGTWTAAAAEHSG